MTPYNGSVLAHWEFTARRLARATEIIERYMEGLANE